MSENIDDIVKDFVIDSYENLERIDRELVLLEQQPEATDIITRIFRSIHTIKGVCGFLSYNKLRGVCHAGESLLSCLRDGRLRLNVEIADALLAMVDAIRQILSCIETARNEGDQEYAPLIGRLTRLYEAAPPPSANPTPRPKMTKLPTSRPAHGAPVDTGAAAEPLIPAPTTTAISGVAAPPASTESAPAQASLATVETPSAVHLSHPVTGTPDVPEKGQTLWDKGIRVDIDLLDRLMTLVGELVLARNQILQYTTEQRGGVFGAASQRLDVITTELQEGVMKTRMQPIGTIWSRFPRLVRDVAVACGKDVRVEMEGMDTELDKTLIEAIKDPLTHLVRNSVDHGIEAPGARVAAGKPREGRLTLSAFHEGGFVNIEITDDGAGINFERVKAKAVAMGLIHADQAPRLSYKEVINLLFLPGFSTAERITDISGRGVGMDVVKTNIERIGGTIDIDTQVGRGTKMTVKVPLTLAIIPALMVVCDNDRFAIPQSSLLELVRLDGSEIKDRIELIHGTPVYRLRNHLLPLIYLKEQLGLTEDAHSQEVASLNIVVLQAAGRHFGLIVDAVRDTEEIVVKPLAKQLQGIGCYAGATILGDGAVALILEVLGLAQKANVLSKVQERETNDAPAAATNQAGEQQTVLLFRAPAGHQMAVPLHQVARLEAFPRATLEHAGGYEMVQYRGEILRLVHLTEVLPEYRALDGDATLSELLHVVVYSHAGRSVGLVIGYILDIVDAPLHMQVAGARLGVQGTTVVGGRITEMLHVDDIVRSIYPGFFEPVASEVAHV